MRDQSVNAIGDSFGSTTSLSLLERVRANDDAAWGRFVSLYTPLVQRWCRFAGLQDADAADIRQKVFLAVATNLQGFERTRGPGSFRGWLRTITNNKITDLRRGDHGVPAVGGEEALEALLQVQDASARPDEELPEREELRILYRRAVELISTDFQETTVRAFWMVVVEERHPSHVAAELNVSTSAVYQAKARVLSRLRQEFKDLIDQ